MLEGEHTHPCPLVRIRKRMQTGEGTLLRAYRVIRGACLAISSLAYAAGQSLRKSAGSSGAGAFGIAVGVPI